MGLDLCFILDHNLKDYRVPLFKKIMEYGYDVTIYHPGPINEKFIKRRQILCKINRFGFFEYRNYKKLRGYDIVIIMQNLRIINVWMHSLNLFRNHKLIHWGIGTSSANGLILKKNIISRLRNFLSCYSDAIVLYSEFPINLFSKLNQKKIFVAHNTIENNLKNNAALHCKDSFIFIGTLNKRKGFDELLISFSKYLKTASVLKINKLLIIGEGPFKEQIKIKAKELKLENNIIFCGKITDLKKKAEYFNRAIVTISPLQAGLSVLESFSFGVPFITFNNAISGGEHLNIQNHKTGFLVNSVQEITERMLFLNSNPKEAKKMGQAAYDHYHNHREIEDMALKFIDAFNFTFQK